MLKAKWIRKVFKEAAKYPGGYKAKLRKLLGVETAEYPEGTAAIRVDRSKAEVGCEEISLRELAEEFLGADFVGGLHNPKTSSHFLKGLQEATVAVTPSNFQDINAWNATVGGLVEVRVLEGYRLPDYIADEFVETMPTKVNGGKIIGYLW
jgi:hypothetical protein